MNCATCLTSGVGKFEHITLVLRDLHWLPVDLSIKFKVFCPTYKALHGLAPKHLAGICHLYNPGKDFRSSNFWLVQVSKICTEKFGVSAFAYVAPFMYNSLPIAIRQSPSLDTFRSWLKPHFFIATFN